MPDYLIGLVGRGIGPSLSPPLHERAAAELGLRYHYRRLDLDELGLPDSAVGDLVARARAEGYRGLNITHPVKQLVLDSLDEVSAQAQAIGAVNTVVFADGRAVGHNTDATGFARGLRAGLPNARLRRVALLGAGGAGAAAAHALLDTGAGGLAVVDVDLDRASALAARLRARFGADAAWAAPTEADAAPAGAGTTRTTTDTAPAGVGTTPTGAGLAEQLAGADGLVHATPVGMAAHPGLPLPAELLRPGLWVADIVYRPLRTELLRVAQARGCQTLDGGRMAVYQAAEAFELFTGHRPDPVRMLRHFAELAGEPLPAASADRDLVEEGERVPAR